MKLIDLPKNRQIEMLKMKNSKKISLKITHLRKRPIKELIKELLLLKHQKVTNNLIFLR